MIANRWWSMEQRSRWWISVQGLAGSAGKASVLKSRKRPPDAFRNLPQSMFNCSCACPVKGSFQTISVSAHLTPRVLIFGSILCVCRVCPLPTPYTHRARSQFWRSRVSNRLRARGDVLRRKRCKLLHWLTFCRQRVHGLHWRPLYAGMQAASHLRVWRDCFSRIAGDDYQNIERCCNNRWQRATNV